MKKFVLFLIISIFLLLMFVACDSGLSYVQMDIQTLPEKLIYSSVDNELDLSGGVVILTTADGTTLEKNMDTYPICVDSDYGVYTNVDFDTPGLYQVTITQCNKVSCVFQIEVV